MFNSHEMQTSKRHLRLRLNTHMDTQNTRKLVLNADTTHQQKLKIDWDSYQQRSEAWKRAKYEVCVYLIKLIIKIYNIWKS